MKFFLNLFFFIFLSYLSFAQGAPKGAFTDMIYPIVQKDSNITFGSNYNWQTFQEDTLQLDIYQPNVSVNYLRPVLIYIHGGGLTAGDKCCDKAQEIGAYFAQRGYIVASINYRLGVEDINTTADNYEEGYEATQDAKASIRFFRRYASDYCVDTSSIFMTGTSAGGSLTLTSAYWDQSEADPHVDTVKLGPLDQSSGNPGYSSQLRAVINCWGGINDTSWMSNNTTPQYLFHGTNDSTVPYTSGYDDNHVFLYGSYDIHQAALRYGIESHLHPFVGAGHGVPEYSPEMDTLLALSNTFLFNHLPADIGRTACLTSVPPSPLDQPSNIMIEPNISSGVFDVMNTSGNIPFDGTVNMFNLNGKLFYAEKLFLAPGDSKHFVFNDLPAGIYFLHFINKKIEVVKKVVINH